MDSNSVEVVLTSSATPSVSVQSLILLQIFVADDSQNLTRCDCVTNRARMSMKCRVLSGHLFKCLIKYKHISDSCEHENTVFIGHINAYLNNILALGHIWARNGIKAYFWSYFRRVSLIALSF
jgi:predicted O-linked N-acetylglucosamine transferase (SPINDLY family)